MKGYVKLGKTGSIVTGIFLFIALITFASQFLSIEQSFRETFGEYWVLVVLFGFLTASLIFILVIGLFASRAAEYLIQRFSKKELSVKILEESELNRGGSMLFDVTFSGMLFHGYFVIDIRSPYWEEKETLVRYDNVKKYGNLKGKYINRQFKLKSKIPSDFSVGEYDVSVRVEDLFFWGFKSKTTKIVIQKDLKITVC